MPTRCLDGISRGLFAAATLLTGAVLVIVSANVAARFLLNEPFYWSEEVTAIAVVLITMFPAAHLLRRGWHIRLDLFLAAEGTGLRRGQELVGQVATLLLGAILTWQAGAATHMVYVQDMREPSLLGAPLWISYSCLLLGSLTLLLLGLVTAVETLRGRGR
ncbi:MAG: TRAP transporter small permease [Candidatus Methylomirabilales bacterium]